MTRRLYLANAAPPNYDPLSTAQGTWSDTTNIANSGGLLRSPSGASANFGNIETNASSTWDVLLGHWTSHALPINITLSGTVQWMIMNLEDFAVADFFTKCHIWVTVGATTAVRGVLLSNFIGTTEWTLTTPTAMTDGVQTLSPVTAQSGDHIAIEFGFRATNAVTTAYTGTLYYGGTTSPDAIAGDTSTAKPKWVEFSNDWWNASGFNNKGLRPRVFAAGLAR